MTLADPSSLDRASRPGADRTVSVALATYNGARFLTEQLASLAAQTLLPFELVVGDDRSTDETAAVVAEFARTAPFPVRFAVNEERLHFGGNFLAAAARCTGRYVAFCDQDDVWLPDKLASSVEALEAADALICGHDAWLVDAEGRRTGRFAHRETGGTFEQGTLPPWGVFFGFTTTIRRDILDVLPAAERGIDPIDTKRLLAHDRWIYVLATTLGRAVYLKEPLALYRQHGNNTFGGASVPLADRLGKLLLTDQRDLARHLDICRRRTALFADAARRDTPYAAAASRGAARWDKLAAIYRRRLALALAPSVLARIAMLAGLARAGAYAATARGGLSARAFGKDAIATFVHRCPVEPDQASATRALS